MALHAVIFLCAFGLFQKGLSALIETQHTVMAAVGEESCLQCQLMQSKNVLQVTWQKVLPAGDDEENIATYTRKFGRTVNPGFNGRVEFKTAGLQNCSINIMNVTERDEGCYRCLFNTIPEGAFIGITCLQIYELHGPFLHVVDSVVSCSATGRPAPMVTLTLPHNNSTSVANSNGTFTVTVTARLHDNSRKVGCAARVLSAPQKEASMTIPEVNMSAIKGERHFHKNPRKSTISKEDSRPDNNSVALALIIVSVVLCCVCVAVAIIAFLCIRRHLKSGSEKDSERTKTPQKSTKDSLETCTPLIKKVNELRLRLSSEKKEKPSETSNLKVTKNLFP